MRLQSVKNVQAREFYETEALRGGRPVRQLSRQIDSRFYERTALSRNKDAALAKGKSPILKLRQRSQRQQRRIRKNGRGQLGEKAESPVCLCIWWNCIRFQLALSCRPQSLKHELGRAEHVPLALEGGRTLSLLLRHPTLPRHGKAPSLLPGQLHPNWVANQANRIKNSDIISPCQNTNRHCRGRVIMKP